MSAQLRSQECKNDNMQHRLVKKEPNGALEQCLLISASKISRKTGMKKNNITEPEKFYLLIQIFKLCDAELPNLAR